MDNLCKYKCRYLHTREPSVPPNQAVQRTPLARLVGWARFTRQSATACPSAAFPNLQSSLATGVLGAAAVGHTRIAWHLPLASVLHAPDACQRRS